MRSVDQAFCKSLYLFFKMLLFTIHYYSAIHSKLTFIHYALGPHYSQIIKFFALYSLSLKILGHYSLISIPHPDPHKSWYWTELNGCRPVRSFTGMDRNVPKQSREPEKNGAVHDRRTKFQNFQIFQLFQ